MRLINDCVTNKVHIWIGGLLRLIKGPSISSLIVYRGLGLKCQERRQFRNRLTGLARSIVLLPVRCALFQQFNEKQLEHYSTFYSKCMENETQFYANALDFFRGRT